MSTSSLRVESNLYTPKGLHVEVVLHKHAVIFGEVHHLVGESIGASGGRERDLLCSAKTIIVSYRRIQCLERAMAGSALLSGHE